jgi:hypothetical protein
MGVLVRFVVLSLPLPEKTILHGSGLFQPVPWYVGIHPGIPDDPTIPQSNTSLPKSHFNLTSKLFEVRISGFSGTPDLFPDGRDEAFAG